MFAYCNNNPVNGMDASGTRFVNTMMTDSGGGFIPPPQPVRIYDCDETRVEYQKVRNSVERTAPGILVSVSVEKVGSRYTVGKDAKRNDQTMDNINNALLGTGSGFIAGYAVGKCTAIGAKIGAPAGPAAAIFTGLLGGALGYIASQIYTDYKNANSIRLDPGSYQIYKATVCSFAGYSFTTCGKQYIWSYVDVYYSIGYGENSSQYNDILAVSPSPRYSYTFGLNFG